jgi:hypothetical protein
MWPPDPPEAQMIPCDWCGKEEWEDSGGVSWNKNPLKFFCSLQCHARYEETFLGLARKWIEPHEKSHSFPFSTLGF